MMRFRYTLNYQPCVRDAFAHISKGSIDILEETDDSQSFVIGRAEIELMDYSRVVKEGLVSISDVIESHGGDWLAIHSLLCDIETGDAYQEKVPFGTFNFITLMNRFELSELAMSREATILHQIAHANGSALIFNMPRSLTRLSLKELANIGFSRIAGSDLITINTSHLY